MSAIIAGSGESNPYMERPDERTDPETTAQKVVRVMREAQAETERLLMDLIDSRRSSSVVGNPESTLLYNAIEMFLLVRFELSVLMEDLANQRGALRANFYGRMLLLTVYESSLSLRSLLGRPFREALASTFPSLDLRAELRIVHSRIHRLSQTCTEEYGEIRNGIVAHRDQNAERRVQLLEQIGGSHVIDLALELSQAITDFLGLVQQVLEHQLNRGK